MLLRFGYCEYTNNLENRIDTILKLCKEGYESRLLLSHDLAVFAGAGETIDSFRMRAHIKPPVGYNFIHKDVLPMLKDGGLSGDTIKKIISENPRRLFEES